MKKIVEVREVRIGEGMPKICVPIVGVTKHEIIEEAKAIHDVEADVVEWRADWFEQVSDLEHVLDTARALRQELEDMPILFTFRTAKEGGERELESKEYATLNKEMAKSGLVDLIDVELFTGEDTVRNIIETAHSHNVYVVASNHDFHKTPEKEEIISRLVMMQKLGADLPKIAVMPQNKADVLTLLCATNEMNEQYADRPIITMSMAGNGVISRICGEVFGSALTFGAAKKASAPGQMEAKELRNVLALLHESMK